MFDVAFGLVNEANNPDEYLLEILALDKAGLYNIDSKYDMTLIGIETGDGVEFSIE